MNHADNKATNPTQTLVTKIVELLTGFLGSLIAGNIGILLLAHFDPQRTVISYFKWLWIAILIALAVILYTRKRVWILIGVVAAMILMAF
jgi:hypothetical protein